MDKLVKLRPFLMQGAFFAALHMGARALRKLSHVPAHPIVQQSPYVMSFPGVAATLTQLGAVCDEAGFRALVEKTCTMLHYHVHATDASQWHMSRLIGEIVQDAKMLCAHAPSASSTEMFRDVLACQEEVIPQLQTHLDDILHNHLLSRAK